MQNYTGNANADMPLTVENVWYFYFPSVQGVHKFFWEKLKTDQLISL